MNIIGYSLRAKIVTTPKTTKPVSHSSSEDLKDTQIKLDKLIHLYAVNKHL